MDDTGGRWACRRSGSAAHPTCVRRAPPSPSCRNLAAGRWRARSLDLDLGLRDPELAPREALALEHADHLGERQAHDIGVGADQLHHERSGDALDGITPGLSLPFAARKVSADLLVREIAEADARLDHALAPAPVRREQADGGVRAMGAAAQEKTRRVTRHIAI